MGKKKFTRVASFMMAMLLLVSSAVIAVSASNTSVTDKSINDYISMSGVATYDEYREVKFADRESAKLELSIDAMKNWSFVSTNGDTVSFVDVDSDGEEDWVLTTKDGKVLTEEEVRAEDSGYNIDDYVYITEKDGKKGLYTPPLGSVTWTVELRDAEGNLIPAAIYNISTDYYPPKNKSSAVEREFYINGEVPFIEARSLTLPKRWSSYMSDGETVQTANVTPTKKQIKDAGSEAAALDAIYAAAVEAGLTAIRGDDGSLQILQPAVVTSKISAFLD